MARKAKRKYSRSAGKDVEREMHKFKRGTLKSGKGGKGGTDIAGLFDNGENNVVALCDVDKNTLDAALLKDWTVKEGKRIQFRFEATNVRKGEETGHGGSAVRHVLELLHHIKPNDPLSAGT